MCRIGTLKQTTPAFLLPPDTKKHASADGASTTTLTSLVVMTSVAIDVKLLSFCAQVTMTQCFSNTSNESPIEAEYEFVLDPTTTSITELSCQIADKPLIRAKLKAKDTAMNQYDDSIASGHTAFLLKQDEKCPERFSINIGNLPPQQSATIKLVYITEAETAAMSDHSIMFTLPRPLANESRQFCATDLRSNFTASVDTSSNQHQQSIESPTHQIIVDTKSPSFSVVSLVDPSTLIGPTDLILLVKLDNSSSSTISSSAVVQQMVGVHNVEHKACMLSFFPKATQEGGEEEVKSEIIFLADCSGSMAGTKMTKLKDTLQLFLSSLPSEGIRFNIVQFGSTHKPLFEPAELYNDASLAKATELLRGMKANFGGTDLLTPLKSILDLPSGGWSRQIFLLTDGQVDDTDECIAEAKLHASSTRIFTFGIGNDASVELVAGVAEAGNGKSQMIYNTDNIRSLVLSQLSLALSPSITNLSINWGESSPYVTHQTPSPLPVLFYGQRLIVYGFLPTTGTGQCEVVLNGTIGTKEFSCKVMVDTQTITTGTQIIKLAAKHLLNDLESSTSGDQEKVKKEAIALSLNCGVLCKWTSFVAVCEGVKEEEGGEATIHSMSQCVLKNYGPLIQPSYAVSVGGKSSGGKSASRGGRGGGRGGTRGPTSHGQRSRKRKQVVADENASDDDDDEETSTTKQEGPVDVVAVLAATQHANGLWSSKTIAQAFNQQVAEKVSQLLHSMQTNKNPIIGSGREDAVISLVIVAILNSQFKQSKAEWQLMATKAAKQVAKSLSKEDIDNYTTAITAAILNTPFI